MCPGFERKAVSEEGAFRPGERRWRVAGEAASLDRSLRNGLKSLFGYIKPVDSTMDRKGTTQMKRLLAHLLAPALGLLVFAGTQAQAGFVGWDYSWTPSSLVVPADSGGTG